MGGCGRPDGRHPRGLRGRITVDVAGHEPVVVTGHEPVDLARRELTGFHRDPDRHADPGSGG
jgi:hypothetical protein